MDSQNLTHLREQGPATKDELPVQIKPKQRANGLTTFDLTNSANGLGMMGGSTTSVYYLAEHEPERVLRRWLEANPRFVEASNRRAFSRLAANHGTPWGEAAREIGREYFGKMETHDGNQETKPRTCPFCGEEFKHLPSHLTGGCSGE